jgi:hypothetical protein
VIVVNSVGWRGVESYKKSEEDVLAKVRCRVTAGWRRDGEEHVWCGVVLYCEIGIWTNLTFKV